MFSTAEHLPQWRRLYWLQSAVKACLTQCAHKGHSTVLSCCRLQRQALFHPTPTTDSLKSSVYSNLMTLTLTPLLYACRWQCTLSLMKAKHCYRHTDSEWCCEQHDRSVSCLHNDVSNMMSSVRTMTTAFWHGNDIKGRSASIHQKLWALQYWQWCQLCQQVPCYDALVWVGMCCISATNNL